MPELTSTLAPGWIHTSEYQNCYQLKPELDYRCLVVASHYLEHILPCYSWAMSHWFLTRLTSNWSWMTLRMCAKLTVRPFHNPRYVFCVPVSHLSPIAAFSWSYGPQRCQSLGLWCQAGLLGSLPGKRRANGISLSRGFGSPCWISQRLDATSHCHLSVEIQLLGTYSYRVL